MTQFNLIYKPVKAGINGLIYKEETQTIKRKYLIEVINDIHSDKVKLILTNNGKYVVYPFLKTAKQIKEMIIYINDFKIRADLTM
jgi:hypothetical protein